MADHYYVHPWGTLEEGRPEPCVGWKCSPTWSPNSSEENCLSEKCESTAKCTGNQLQKLGKLSWFYVTRFVKMINTCFGLKL